MRDIALTVVVFGLLPFVFYRPHIGALMWAWISLMNPHRLTYGFAFNFPFAQAIAVTTLIALPLSKHRKPFPWGPIPALLILFIGWMSVTSLFAMGDADSILTAWVRVMKIHLMLLVTLMLIRGREQIEQLIWVLVLSIGFYGVKGGAWTVLTGGGERVWGPAGGVIEGNNELALALVILIPLMYYLFSTTSRKWIKYGLVFAMVLCAFSILGSQSRGAFLAIVAATGMLALKSRRPVLFAIFGIAALGSIMAFMPESWVERMNTIGTYESDGSASSRLNTWLTLWNMVLDRPITGAGFDTALVEIFSRYSPIPSLAYSAHSTYFQALGEHGFVGLIIYLTLVWVTWRRASTLARYCERKTGLEWAVLLMRMVQVSLLGFLVGATFLNLLHFDFPYYLMGLVVLLDATLKEQKHEARAPQPAMRSSLSPSR